MLRTEIDRYDTTLEDDGSSEPAPMGPGFVIAIVVAASAVILTALLS